MAIKLIIRQSRTEQALLTHFFRQGEQVPRLLLTFDIDNPQGKPRQLYNFPAFSMLFFANFRFVCFQLAAHKIQFSKVQNQLVTIDCIRVGGRQKSIEKSAYLMKVESSA